MNKKLTYPVTPTILSDEIRMLIPANIKELMFNLTNSYSLGLGKKKANEHLQMIAMCASELERRGSMK